MDAPPKERTSERPPSPSAPERGWSRTRTRAMAGAAALTLGLATFLGPAAADELTGGDTAATEEAGASDPTSTTTEATAVEVERTSATTPEWSEQELAFFQALHDQKLAAFYEAAHRQQVEAFLDAAARHEAEKAEAERAERERVERERQEQREREQARQPQQQAPAAPAPAGGPWDALAQCESGGNWSINTGNGYYGGLQFSLQTWQAYGGQGMPHENSKGAQIAVAQRVQAGQGWGAWPSCSRQIGLR